MQNISFCSIRNICQNYFTTHKTHSTQATILKFQQSKDFTTKKPVSTIEQEHLSTSIKYVKKENTSMMNITLFSNSSDLSIIFLSFNALMVFVSMMIIFSKFILIYLDNHHKNMILYIDEEKRNDSLSSIYDSLDAY